MIRTRICAAMVLGVCGAILIAAAQLQPSRTGLGTHTQMGLGACHWLGDHGYVCPTCGWTTAFSLAAHGRLIDAVATQPAAATVAMIMAMACWVGGYVLITGAPIGKWLSRLIRPGVVIVGAIVIALAGWMYKIMIG